MTDITEEVVKSILEEQFEHKNLIFYKFLSKLSDVIKFFIIQKPISGLYTLYNRYFL